MTIKVNDKEVSLTYNTKIMVTTLKRGATKKNIKSILDKLKNNLKPKGVNVYKYCGKLNLKKDALDIQKELRNEW